MEEGSDNPTIGSTHQPMFNWEVHDSPDSVSVTFAVPDDFDVSTINVALNSSKTAISVTIPDEPPLLCGTLTSQVLDATLEIHEKEAVVKMEKAAPRRWDLVVVAVHPETKTTDPKSAFLLYELHCRLGQVLTEDGTDYLAMLRRSASDGYLNAIAAIAKFGINSESSDLQLQGIEWLKFAAQAYKDPKSMTQLAWYLGSAHGHEEEALEYLRSAVALGHVRAWWVLGMMYSPYSEYFEEFTGKNVAKAIDCFEKAGNDKEVLEELEKLYSRGGDGVPPNPKKAAAVRQALYGESRWSYGWAIGSVIVVGMAVALGVFFARRRAKK